MLAVLEESCALEPAPVELFVWYCGAFGLEYMHFGKAGKSAAAGVRHSYARRTLPKRGFSNFDG
jgi:hypothetical protein